MAKLKGLNKINHIVNNFTRKNFNVCADLDTEFEAFCDSRKIGYTFVMDEDNHKFFIEDAQRRYPELQADIFLWCLMHEIGHCMTEYIWTDKENEYFEYQKDQCAYIEDDQMRNDYYHAIPDEFLATKWAGDYMMAHPEKIAKFWIKLQRAIIKFYRKNGLM